MGKSLTVALPDFRDLLRRISLTKRRASGDTATLTFRRGFGELEIGSTTLVFHAKGNWRGEARFPATMLVALKQAPPTSDPVTITFESDRIAFGSLRMGATWSAAVPDRPVIPEEAEWTDVLLAVRTLRNGPAMSDVLRSRVLSAERELSERIARAASELSPLGITQSDIRALVEVRFLELRTDEIK